MDGAELIRLERERQITECKHTPQHDDTEHANADFAVIAAGLLCHGTAASVTDQKARVSLDMDAWGLIKKYGDDPVRLLTIAGALVAAEIDRLTRQQQKEMASMSPSARNCWTHFHDMWHHAHEGEYDKDAWKTFQALLRTALSEAIPTTPGQSELALSTSTGTNAAAPPEEDDVPF